VPDLVLIDDDELIHAAWALVAESRGEELVHVTDPDAFPAASIPRETPIFVDYLLGGGRKGTDVAKELHDLGFKKLYLTTGLPLDPASVPGFVAGVVGKSYPSRK
jgi:hypothetical protein